MTIQSNSPRISFVNLAGSMCRCAEIDASASPESLSRVLGLGGSSSLIMRRISPYAAALTRLPESGVLPVSNSYSSTPSE
jgi:hypothetical protein